MVEHEPIANLVEFFDEGSKDDTLEIKEVELVPTKIDDLKAEVQDLLLEINLGMKDSYQPIYIIAVMGPEIQTKTKELLREFTW